MKNIKKISIVEENGQFKNANVTYIDDTFEMINGRDNILSIVSAFSAQTGIIYDELVRYNLISIKKEQKKESLGGRLKVGNLSYDLVRYLVPMGKLDYGTDKSVVLIADMHDYSKYRDKANALAKAIKSRHPHHVVVAGDNIQGKKWETTSSVRDFKYFLDNVSEEAPVFVSQGNHDLVGLNASNQKERIGNFKKLEHGGRVHALVNDRVFIDGFEIIGFTPTPSIISSLTEQESGIAHDKFIREYHDKGVKPVKTDKIVEFVGHSPFLIGNSANGVGLEDLVPVDVFFTGHLHNGYRKSDTVKANPDEFLDAGYVEKPISRGPDGSIRLSTVHPFIGPTNLCRGVVYVDDRSQQRYLQLRNNHFYVNKSTKDNEQFWVPIEEEKARDEIIENKLHALIISGGIRKFFGFDLDGDNPEITEVVYKGTKR